MSFEDVGRYLICGGFSEEGVGSRSSDLRERLRRFACPRPLLRGGRCGRYRGTGLLRLLVDSSVSIKSVFFVFFASCNDSIGVEESIEGSKHTQDLITVEGFLGHCCGGLLLLLCQDW